MQHQWQGRIVSQAFGDPVDHVKDRYKEKQIHKLHWMHVLASPEMSHCCRMSTHCTILVKLQSTRVPILIWPYAKISGDGISF